MLVSSPEGDRSDDNSTARDSDPAWTSRRMGMIGFDIACAIVRSGSRMQGYLVNDLCKK
jgi:hypothetical protein